MNKLLIVFVYVFILTACSKNESNSLHIPVKNGVSEGDYYKQSKGFVYKNFKGETVTAPALYISKFESQAQEFVCEKQDIYAGAASRVERTAYRKMYKDKTLVSFEKVGTDCKFI